MFIVLQLDCRFLACLLQGVKNTQTDFCRKTGVTEVTLRKLDVCIMSNPISQSQSHTQQQQTNWKSFFSNKGYDGQLHFLNRDEST